MGNTTPEYETHLWLRLELPDGRIVESPEPEGEGWEQRAPGGWAVKPWRYKRANGTQISECWADEYRSLGLNAKCLDAKDYRRLIVEKEHEQYDALGRSPLLWGMS